MYRLLIIFAFGTTLISAQDETTVPEPGPPQVEPGLGEPGVPAAGDISAQIVDQDIIQPQLDGEALAEFYTRFTGRRVTLSVAASTAEFRFIQQAPMTYGEAAQLIKKAALLEGFVFVPDVNMANHDVLVMATAGANPKGEGLQVISDPADLPNDDRIVTYVMSLRYIKPEEIVRTFTTVIGQLGPYGSITPVPNAGAVIITEKTSLIRRLIELVDEIDVSAQIATRFIKVQFADVAELAATLNEILNTQSQGQRTAGVQRVNNPAEGAAPPVPGGVPGAPGAGGTGGGGNAAEDVPIQIVPDTRTNRIFAMGRPVDIVFIEGLVREFDSQTDERNYLRRKLKFVAVADFLNVAEPALERAFSGSGDGSVGGGRSTGANFGGAQQQTTGRNQRTNTGQGGQGGFGGQTGGQGGFGAAGNTLADPTINSAPEARLVGRTLLVADNITNSLVVQGPPASVEIIENLLDQLDVKSEQVMISAIFGQLQLDNDRSLGVDFLQNLGDGSNGAVAGRAGGGGFPLLPLDGTAWDPGSLAGPGLGVYGRIGSNFNVVLRALQTRSDFKILSRPTIFTANNQRGSISSGQQIAVPTNTFNTGGVGGATQSTNIEFRDVLLNLEVIPLVNSEDEVTLQIALLNDEIVGSQNIDGNDIPTIGRREVLTTVTVPNGSTIALGGLITTRAQDTVTGIPLLSDIPGIGRLFSTTSNVENREELMIFIQPTIVKDPSSLYDAQVDMDARYNVSDETRDFAQGPAVLPDRGAIPAGEGTKGYVPPRPVIIEQPEDDDHRVHRMLGRPGSFRRR